MLILDVRNEEDFERFNVEGPYQFEMANVPYFDFMEEEDVTVSASGIESVMPQPSL